MRGQKRHVTGPPKPKARRHGPSRTQRLIGLEREGWDALPEPEIETYKKWKWKRCPECNWPMHVDLSLCEQCSDI